MSLGATFIPELDVQRLTPDAAHVRRLAADLHRAFTTVGFVAITNHGVPLELVRSTLGFIRSMFFRVFSGMSRAGFCYSGEVIPPVHGAQPLFVPLSCCRVGIQEDEHLPACVQFTWTF